MELFKSRTLQDHYRNPRNAGCLENPDGAGRASNPVTGDVTEIYLKIKAGCIIDARFKSFGSPAVIAVSSLLTETVKGKEIDSALAESSAVLGQIVGELSPDDLHCLVMAKEAFMRAIEDYRSRSRAKLKTATG